MKNCLFFCVVLLSPSSRAEWVEIVIAEQTPADIESPSSRAEWVEINISIGEWKKRAVSVLAGGVG